MKININMRQEFLNICYLPLMQGIYSLWQNYEAIVKVFQELLCI